MTREKGNEWLVPTPWDKKSLGIDTYEIASLTEDALEAAMKVPGHFTVRVDPLQSKELLAGYKFYYCDTLIEPFCKIENFKPHRHESVRVTHSPGLDHVLEIAHGAFKHGRFHRDFNIPNDLADLRYDNWVIQLHRSGNIIGLLYDEDPAAFFGTNGNKIVLHAVHERFRGKGLAKYLWTAGVLELVHAGNDEITSSVSASNTAVINLYASLGFRFRNPMDIYHFFNPQL